MPQKVRLDASGAMHHIIMRRIDRRKFFFDDADRNDFSVYSVLLSRSYPRVWDL